MTWDEAIDEAMVPTDLDRYFHEKGGIFGKGEPRLNNAGTELTDFSIIRERAAMKYIEAHEGEEAEVEYVNPNAKSVGSRWVYRAKGTLRKQYVKMNHFGETDDPNLVVTVNGFVVGDTVVPLDGVSAIRVEADKSVVVL